MEDQNNNEYIYYKVDTKHFYKVYKKSYGGVDYYKILITQTNFDKTKTNFYTSVKFKKSLIPPEDGSIIRIKQGVENYSVNKKDAYNHISFIVVLDYELKETEEKRIEKAYNDFTQNLANNESENGDHISISDDSLPF